MCFAVPYKVLEVRGNTVLIETGKTVRLGTELTASVGDYVRVLGAIAVDVLPADAGTAVREALESLNAHE